MLSWLSETIAIFMLLLSLSLSRGTEVVTQSYAAGLGSAGSDVLDGKVTTLQNTVSLFNAG
jgi:hypothetical protein